MNTKNILLTTIAIASLLSLVGCSKDSGDGKQSPVETFNQEEAPRIPEPVELISRYTGGDYTTATYSFRHQTRDNVDLTRGNWEILFEARDSIEDFFKVNTVVDDNSFIYDLGNRSCAAIKSSHPEIRKTRPLVWLSASDAAPNNKTPQTQVKVQVGHCYLTYNNDSDGRVVALFRVAHHEKSKRVLIDEIEVLDVLTRND